MDVFYSLIVDNLHTHPAAVRMAHRTYPSGCVLVTDAVAPMGLRDGSYRFGVKDVTLKGARIALADEPDVLAGSAASMDHCVRLFADVAGTIAALEAASLHPAQALGITDRKGTLAFGSDADLVLLTSDLRVRATYIAGECVWRYAV